MKNKKKTAKKFLEVNKNAIVTGIVCFAIGALVMIPFFPERIGKLANGEEVIVEVGNHKFTADDLYKALKEKNGNEALFKMVDLAILKDKYPNEEDNAKKFQDEQKESVFASYQEYWGYTKEQFLEANGFSSEEEFEKELNSQYYYQKYYDDYVSSTITEKELNKFYKDSVFGDKSIYLFSAVDENKGDLEDIQKRLKEKKSFTSIKDKFTNVNAYSYDVVKFNDTDTFNQNILNHVASTSKESDSGIFNDDSYGNVLIYVVSENEKPSLDEVKDSVRSTIVKNKQNSDEKLYYQAFIHLREDNNLNILDTELKDFYDTSIKQYK